MLYGKMGALSHITITQRWDYYYQFLYDADTVAIFSPGISVAKAGSDILNLILELALLNW